MNLGPRTVVIPYYVDPWEYIEGYDADNRNK